MGNSKLILDIKDLISGYGKLTILNNVSLELQHGEFVCLLGPNGAGKSTLLKSIFGVCNITGGSILYQEEELRGLKPQNILIKGISLIPQGRCNFPLMTVEENLEMAAYTRNDRNIKRSIEYVYSLFSILSERRKEVAINLSGGEQQLLETGMALMLNPKVLLVDEASLGLSPKMLNMVFEEIKRLNEDGITILMVEQNTRKAMEIANRTIVMRLGTLIWDGPTNTINSNELGSLFMTGEIQ